MFYFISFIVLQRYASSLCIICVIVINCCLKFASIEKSLTLLVVMDERITPYSLPETANHSFLFTRQVLPPKMEAKLHQHDAWELYCVVKGFGHRTVGDKLLPFSAGDVVLIPPAIPHQWSYESQSADDSGNVGYLMVAFNQALLSKSIDLFPEVRNAFANITIPTEARRFHGTTAKTIRHRMEAMEEMNDLDQLVELLRLLPLVFSSDDYISVGRHANYQEKNIRRMMDISTYVMKHFQQSISLDDIARHVGMNRSSFCIYFKRQKGITFSQFVTQYRLDTACELLGKSNRQISDIAYSVGFNDLSHFVHIFSKAKGMSPTAYRKQIQNGGAR